MFSFLEGVLIVLSSVPTTIPDSSTGTAESDSAMAVVIAPDVMTDCNMNGYDDIEDIVQGRSLDANVNLVPDECEPPIPVPLAIGDAPQGGTGTEASLVSSLAEELLIVHETWLQGEGLEAGDTIEFLWQDGLVTYVATLSTEATESGSFYFQGSVTGHGWTGMAGDPVTVSAAIHPLD